MFLKFEKNHFKKTKKQHSQTISLHAKLPDFRNIYLSFGWSKRLETFCGGFGIFFFKPYISLIQAPVACLLMGRIFKNINHTRPNKKGNPKIVQKTIKPKNIQISVKLPIRVILKLTLLLKH